MKLHKIWSRKRESSRKADLLDSDSPSPSPSSSKSRMDSSSELFFGSSQQQKQQHAPLRSHSAEIYSDSSTSSGQASDSSNNSASNGNAPPKHIQELHDAFRYFDSNGDGKISVAELGKVLMLLGENPSEEDLQGMVREADADGDGFVSLEEFVNLNTRGLDKNTGVLASVDELRAVFCVFDTDRNGYISAEELHGVLLKLGEHELTVDDCNRMIGGVDADGDGRVDFEEFKRMMSSSC